MSSNQYLEQLEETLEDLKKLVSQRTSPISGFFVTHLFVKKWGWGKLKRVLFLGLGVVLQHYIYYDLKRI